MGLGLVMSAFAQPRSAANTPGKEYTDNLDVDSTGALDATRNLHWFGDGTVVDSIKYERTGQVDALAAPFDAYFWETVNNQSALLFSVAGDAGGPIRYEMPDGSFGVWATDPMINKNGVNDLDALEVWGPDGADDGTMYSKFSDGGGFAVWGYTGTIGAPVGVVTDTEISLAVGLPNQHVDLDALMMYGETLIFSIRAIGPYDGGEIFVYSLGEAAVPGYAPHYLFHGGHLWDTAFNVGATFGCPTDEIDALEAVDVVPEPASMAALALGALGVLRRRTKKA